MNHVEIQTFYEYIKHWWLEVWETSIFYKLQHKGMIMKNKTFDQHDVGMEVAKCMV
jgi:hypothetical protein